jgi:hypothetical protein
MTMQGKFASVHAVLAFATAMMIAAAPSSAQTAPGTAGTSRPAFEIAFTYDATNSLETAGSRFWMQGGAAQIHGQFYSGWGAVADLAGAHVANINSTGVGLDLITATFGPRYTWHPRHARYALYGQGLVGEAWGMNSVFPNPAGANTTARSLAVKAGGGVNIDLARHLALRAIEAGYLRTQLPNSAGDAQNNLQLGAGIVLRLR